MVEPWRVAVIGCGIYPEANRRVYARLKMLRDDWPKIRFHIVTGPTGMVCMAALRAAKKLGMDYTACAGIPTAERYIAYWDLKPGPAADQIRYALDMKVHVEVWDMHNEPAGTAAVDALEAM
jgi:hypothetical protein